MSFNQRTKHLPSISLKPGDGTPTHSPLWIRRVWVCDLGPPSRSGTLLEAKQDKEKPLQNSDYLQTTILSPIPCKHPQRQQQKVQFQEPRMPCYFPLPSFLCVCPRAKSSVQERKGGPSIQLSLRSGLRGYPLNTGPAEGDRIESKIGLALWLFKLCPPPLEVSSSSQALHYPVHRPSSAACPETPPTSPAPHITHTLFKKLGSQQFLWAQTISELTNVSLLPAVTESSK